MSYGMELIYSGYLTISTQRFFDKEFDSFLLFITAQYGMQRIFQIQFREKVSGTKESIIDVPSEFQHFVVFTRSRRIKSMKYHKRNEFTAK